MVELVGSNEFKEDTGAVLKEGMFRG